MLDIFPRLSFASSKLLTEDAFAALCEGATVLEQDVRGVKVWQLTNGKILKVFRLRGIFTSNRIYSNARSFCRNANRLNRLGIATIGANDLFHLSKSSNTVVIYEPLKGKTLKHLLHEDGFYEKDCVNLGVFIANLHRLGIHFKSLHFGNIVRTNSGELGLIDISDMRIFPWQLMTSTRVRGFRRLLNYHEDMKMIGEKKWEVILNSYIKNSDLNSYQTSYLKSKLAKFNQTDKHGVIY